MANIKKIVVPGGLGDASPNQVLAGVTFTSNSGVKQTGTLVSSDSDSVTLMVRTDDGEYPVANTDTPKKLDDGNYAINITQ